MHLRTQKKIRKAYNESIQKFIAHFNQNMESQIGKLDMSLALQGVLVMWH